MSAINAVNWHIPRIPQQGMTHLHCRHTLIDFASSEACQKASTTQFCLCGHSLYWYEPSVATCYKCGKHGHLQVACPMLGKGTQVAGRQGARQSLPGVQAARGALSGNHQEGISYAAMVKSRQGAATAPSWVHPVNQQTSSAGASVSTSFKADKAISKQLDALEAQVNELSGCFHGFLDQFNSIAKTVTSIEQMVKAIARHIFVSSQVEPGIGSAKVASEVSSGASIVPNAETSVSSAVTTPSMLPTTASCNPTSVTSKHVQVSGTETSVTYVVTAPGILHAASASCNPTSMISDYTHVSEMSLGSECVQPVLEPVSSVSLDTSILHVPMLGVPGDSDSVHLEKLDDRLKYLSSIMELMLVHQPAS